MPTENLINFCGRWDICICAAPGGRSGSPPPHRATGIPRLPARRVPARPGPALPGASRQPVRRVVTDRPGPHTRDRSSETELQWARTLHLQSDMCRQLDAFQLPYFTGRRIANHASRRNERGALTALLVRAPLLCRQTGEMRGGVLFSYFWAGD